MSAKPSLEEPPVGRARLVIFDLDGVIWDSRQNMALAWDEVRAQLGVPVSFEAYFARIGEPFPAIMRRLGLGDRATEIERVFRMASMTHMAAARFYPGAPEMLRTLQEAGVRLGLVTSKDALRTSAILALLPTAFDVVRTPDESSRGKPAPDHLLMAMAMAGVDPADTVYVGDMDSDFQAAARARIGYAHAAWGYGEEPAGCRLVLREPAELSVFLPDGTEGRIE